MMRRWSGQSELRLDDRTLAMQNQQALAPLPGPPPGTGGGRIVAAKVRI